MVHASHDGFGGPKIAPGIHAAASGGEKGDMELRDMSDPKTASQINMPQVGSILVPDRLYEVRHIVNQVQALQIRNDELNAQVDRLKTLLEELLQAIGCPSSLALEQCIRSAKQELDETAHR